MIALCHKSPFISHSLSSKENFSIQPEYNYACRRFFLAIDQITTVIIQTQSFISLCFFAQYHRLARCITVNKSCPINITSINFKFYARKINLDVLWVGRTQVRVGVRNRNCNLLKQLKKRRPQSLTKTKICIANVKFSEIQSKLHTNTNNYLVESRETREIFYSSRGLFEVFLSRWDRTLFKANRCFAVRRVRVCSTLCTLLYRFLSIVRKRNYSKPNVKKANHLQRVCTISNTFPV